MFEVYQLDERDIKQVLIKEGTQISELPISSKAKNEFRIWLNSNYRFKVAEDVLTLLDELEEQDQEQISDFDTLYLVNNDWEDFCIKHNVNPVEAWYQFRKAGILPPQRTQTLAFELITDVTRTVLAKDDDGIIPLGDKMGEERLAIRIEREMIERGYHNQTG